MQSRSTLPGDVRGACRGPAADARDRPGARAKARALLLDEPSLGLAPLLIQQILNTVRELADSGVTLILAEQNATAPLKIPTTGMDIDKGRIARVGDAQALLEDALSLHRCGGHP